MEPEQEKYDEPSIYTLAHRNSSFVHQYIVDAFAAQTADENTKPIKLTFALIGLYLHIERGFTGKEVQRVHMLLAKYRKQWPTFKLPEQRGAITVSNVLAVPAGPERDEIINRWSAAVWAAYSESRQQVIDLVQKELY